jgi:valyl-tRNA synthetase
MCPSAELYIPLGELVDIEKETARLQKEGEGLRREVGRAEGKLNNPGFTAKAPPNLVEAEREKLAANRAMLTALEARLRDLLE